MRTTKRQIVGFMLATIMGTQADTVLQNDFGAGADVGPGFQLVSNGLEDNDTSNPATGLISFSDNGGGVPAVGFTSSSALDLSSYSGFTVTWTVGSTDSNLFLNANGLFLGLTDTVGVQGDGSTLWNNAPAAIGVKIIGDAKVVTDSPDAILFDGAAVADADLADGFTVSLTLNNDDTWSAVTTGLTTDINETGNLSAGYYAGFADSVVAYTSMQHNNAGVHWMQYDSVSITTIPEPATLGLIAGTGIGVLFIRRRLLV